MSLTVSAKDWDAYIRRLSALNETAAEKMRDFVRKNGFGDMNALIEYAYALATKYGEGAATLAAAMYDAVAELSGKLFDPAIPAETASYDQVAKTVQGVAKVSQNPEEMGSAVGRLVKQAGADTTLQNALRDGAEFAWVPSGDTCAFCITLASRGWQRASKKAIKGGHAEHIHSNCDCTYAIRFDGKGGVAGYDPEKYLRMYEGAEGDTPREKINALRRENYAEHKEEINAQKRAAYAERKEREREEKANYIDITGKWYQDAKPGSHQVQDLLTYTAPDGSVYTVHGTDVVLDYDEHEKEIAELLEREIGGELYMVPRVNKPEGVKTPDYLFHGKAYDLKTPEASKSKNAVFKRVKKASGQAHGIILDVSISGLGDEAIDEQIDKIFWSQDTKFVDELVLVKNGKIKKVFKRK